MKKTSLGLVAVLAAAAAFAADRASWSSRGAKKD